MKRKRRQVFVFTAEEKKVAACIVAALALGLVTIHYRARHPVAPRPLSKEESRATKVAQRAASAKERRARTTQAVTRASPIPHSGEEED